MVGNFRKRWQDHRWCINGNNYRWQYTTDATGNSINYSLITKLDFGIRKANDLNQFKTYKIFDTKLSLIEYSFVFLNVYYCFGLYAKKVKRYRFPANKNKVIFPWNWIMNIDCRRQSMWYLRQTIPRRIKFSACWHLNCKTKAKQLIIRPTQWNHC